MTLTENTFQLPTLTPAEREALLTYAEVLLKAQQVMQQTAAQSILHHLLRGQPSFTFKKHYPKGDRIDHTTGAQYFYHCHRENLTTEEHGHFHCFLRYKQIPKTLSPTPLADWDKYIKNPMTHLVAIAMNRYGQPIRLFAVNRWVTSEIWYDAADIQSLLTPYRFTLTDDPYWTLLDTWMEAMIHLFAPQICWLQKQRELAIMQYEAQHDDIYNNKAVEELAEIPINLTKHIQWILNDTKT